MTHTLDRPGGPRLSIVIPVFNEADNLEPLVELIHQAMASLTDSYEILFVDDGSTDRTLATLKSLVERCGRIGIYSFRRNLGKSAALLCGFQKATGDFILTLDGDLQDDPHDVRRMYDQLIAEDVDVISGWRRERRDSAVKVASSRLFNRLVVRLLFDEPYQDMNSGLKLYRAEVARNLPLYGGLHRFIPVIAVELGYRVSECPVSHHPRRHGASKYSSVKIFTELPDLLTVFFLIKYTTRPLHFFGRIGSVLIAIGVLILTYLTALWLQGTGIGTRPLLTLGVLLVVIGAKTVFTGLLADLVVHINHDKGREFPLKYTSTAVADVRTSA